MACHPRPVWHRRHGDASRRPLPGGVFHGEAQSTSAARPGAAMHVLRAVLCRNSLTPLSEPNAC
ncbi:hypothetical protein CBM2633_B60125 [Cupriavidus taiwanensis]|nr:hypothetical protein CBM2604_B40174 [Cupriavidus taiwanensis]SOZ32488.1 hypothetical protein CBM2609_B30177 [Cupriavidus taiwanensis]SOZ48075.1 hypothetical protein CBM2610_B30174 [Cupriavidus taiwanensis]SPA02967.1 hypothetical protein CBM2626_B50167 [Cupriavidus taiwanensis]SPA22179.1 hypothetical protein CBM2633_B60125 [Cupriavidus taiwanensis]